MLLSWVALVAQAATKRVVTGLSRRDRTGRNGAGWLFFVEAVQIQPCWWRLNDDRPYMSEAA